MIQLKGKALNSRKYIVHIILMLIFIEKSCNLNRRKNKMKEHVAAHKPIPVV